MLNVYFTVQKMNRGLPQQTNVMMIRHRKVESRQGAFADVLVQFGEKMRTHCNMPFEPYQTAFATLLGQASAKDSTGASAVVDGKVLIVSVLEGEQCEVAGRGY